MPASRTLDPWGFGAHAISMESHRPTTKKEGYQLGLGDRYPAGRCQCGIDGASNVTLHAARISNVWVDERGSSAKTRIFRLSQGPILRSTVASVNYGVTRRAINGGSVHGHGDENMNMDGVLRPDHGLPEK